jgi:4-amino-4-deoxy-L-arabinose transferase-like glycosyltransferase
MPPTPAIADAERQAARTVPQGASSRCPRPATIVLALTLLAAALRFGTLDVQSIWLDESATILLVHRGFAGMLSHLPSSESAPPLYYVLVWAWTKIFGLGPLGFRSFSALMGTLTIPVIYLVGKRVSVRVGLWAAALAAVSPVLYYYSQEARGYALLILLSTAAFLAWQHALREPTIRKLAWWSGLSALALLTHYFAVFVFLPEAAVLIRRVSWRKSSSAIAPVAIVGLALVPLALRQRGGGQSDWIQTTSLLSRFAQAPKQFLVGLYSPLEIFSAALAGILAAMAVWLLVVRGNARERRHARDVTIVAVGALAIPLLLAVTHLQDVFNGRNVMAAWAPWAVLVASGLGIARAGRIGALLGASLCAISLLVILATDTNPGYQREDWRGVSRSLGSPTSERVLVTEQNGLLPLDVYLPRVSPIHGLSVSTREVAFIGLPTARTGRAPLAAVVPMTAPTGFRLAEVHRTGTYAISRFIATKEQSVSQDALRRAIKEPTAEVLLQP